MLFLRRLLRQLPFWPVLSREVYAFFVSPMAYVLLTVWLLYSGFSFWMLSSYYASQPLGAGAQDSPLTAFFGQTTLFYLPMLVFVPLVTMRLLAEEKSRGTIEVLMTAPITEASVVIGKYLAAIAIWLAMWTPTLLYVWLTSRYGDVDLGAVASSYAGILGIGAYYLGIGTLMSALAKNQIVAAILTFFALAGLFIVGLGQFVFGEEYREVFAYLSIWGHMEAFSRGVVDSRYVLFDLSVAIGALALAGLALHARGREVRWGSPDGRWPIYNVLLGIALLCQVNYLSYRHYDRWDWTQHSIYTLSERTETIASELNRDVEIWILLSESEEGFGELRNLLARYTALSSHIHVHYVDPDRDPGGYREIAQRFELGAISTGETVLSDVAAVLDAGERHWEITRDDLISRHFDPLGEEDSIELNVEGERAISGALAELMQGRPTRVCVSTGHGELSATGTGASLAGFASEMRRENLELSDITLRTRDSLSREDCDALAIIGPDVAFSAPEVDVVREYVRGGGNLLLAVDPVPTARQTGFLDLGFERTLRDFGISLDRSVVIEPNPALLPAGGGHPLGPYAVVGWGDHPITQPFTGMGLPIVVSEARSVRPLDADRATVLLTTSEQSYAETDLRSLARGVDELRPDAADIAGPVPIAVAAQVEVTRPDAGGVDDEDDAAAAADDDDDDEETAPPGGRVVVIGDATMFESDFLSEPTVVNRNFVSAVMGWLTERQALLAIEARTIESHPVSMSEDDVSTLFFRVVVLIPLAFVFLGFAVWWNRRQ
ncbi:MAG: Gldg family protein [Sandaracinaceae bacterium]